MTLLDGKKKLNPEIFSAFMSKVKDQETVAVFWTALDGTDRSGEFAKDELIDKVFSREFGEVIPDDKVVTFACNEAALEILGKDLHNYDDSHAVRHRNLKKGLQSYANTEGLKSIAPEHQASYYRHIAVSIEKNGVITEVSDKEITTSVEGVLVQSNDWMMSNRYCLAADNGSIRFDFNYKPGHEKDPSYWKSIDQLVEEGTAVLAN